MAYDSLRGALFKNQDKSKPVDRDYGGELNIDGTLYWVSAWLRTAKKSGTKYLALSLKPKDIPSDENKSKPSLDDEIPW